ncbi:MAG: hypothetical protein C5B52_05865 [Bacteroidetes bacterium]|nr:MAG: hypothetical protein C5B52_05865 [Bacteroidota bacterium]
MKFEQETLVIMSPGFPKDEEDSTCLPAQQSFVRLAASQFPGIQLIILSFEYPFRTDEYYWNGIRVIPFNGRSKNRIQRIFLWMKIWQTLKTLKKKNNLIGILSFWCTECAFIGQWFGKFNRIKHLSWISGQDAKKQNGYIRFMKLKSENLIAMSDFLQAEFLKNHGIRATYVIPIGIEPAQYSFSRAGKDIDLMGAGSLIPLKQFDVFVSVVRKILAALPETKSYICGEGPAMNELKEQIKQVGINGQLVLAGKKKHQELLEMMGRTKVFLHTSSYEGFGAVCIEALYAGAHVISFTQPVSAWIRHWHVVKDEEEMCKKAIELLQDPETSYSTSAPFLMSDTVRKIIGLYQNQELN